MELLLRRATQGNDLDTALKIKTELEAMTSTSKSPASGALLPQKDAPQPQPGNPAPAAAAFTDLKLQLPGSKWKTVEKNYSMEFRVDGTALLAGSKPGKYEVKAHDKVIVTLKNMTTGKNQEPELYTLSRDGRHLERPKGNPFYVLESAK